MFETIKPGDVIKATRCRTNNNYVIGIVIKNYPKSDGETDYFIKVLDLNNSLEENSTSNWKRHDISDKTGKYLAHKHYCFEKLVDSQTDHYIISPHKTGVLTVSNSGISCHTKNNKEENFRVSTGIYIDSSDYTKSCAYAIVSRNEEFSGIAIIENFFFPFDTTNRLEEIYKERKTLIKFAYAREEQVRMKMMEERILSDVY